VSRVGCRQSYVTSAHCTKTFSGTGYDQSRAPRTDAPAPRTTVCGVDRHSPGLGGDGLDLAIELAQRAR